MQYADLPDERLAADAAEDRQEAFSALYDRYLPVLYDLARRLLRSDEEATDVGRAVFAAAHQSLDQKGAPSLPVRTWLFSLLHREVTATLRRAPTVEYGSEEALARIPPVPREQETPVDVEYREIAPLVWQGFRELRPEDQELVLFHVRGGLDAPELATVLGRRREQAQSALAQARETFEAIVTALIVLNKGRRTCQELDDLAYGFQHSPRLIDQIAEHASGCPFCQQTRSRYVSGAEILGALVPVPVPPGISGTIWRQVMEGSAVATGATTAMPIPAAAAGVIARVQTLLPWERLRSIHPVVLAIAVFLAVTSLAFFLAYAVGSRLRDNATATPPTPQRLANATPTTAALIVIPPVTPTSGTPSVTLSPTLELTDTPLPVIPTIVPAVVPTRPPAPPTATDVPRPAPTATNGVTPIVVVETAIPTGEPGGTATVPSLGTPTTAATAVDGTTPPALPTGALPPLTITSAIASPTAPGVTATVASPAVLGTATLPPTIFVATVAPTSAPTRIITAIPTATSAPAEPVPTLGVIIIAPAGTATSTPSGP
jgi:RNA polymerase sigma factor (sigma-70 family)